MTTLVVHFWCDLLEQDLLGQAATTKKKARLLSRSLTRVDHVIGEMRYVLDTAVILGWINVRVCFVPGVWASATPSDTMLSEAHTRCFHIGELHWPSTGSFTLLFVVCRLSNIKYEGRCFVG